MKPSKNKVKVYIENKAHFQIEWSDAIKKGFTLENGITKIPNYTPESIVYHLGERIITPLQRDFIETGCGKLYYFEDAQVVQGIKSIKKPRKRNPKKSAIIVSREFDNLKDACDYIKDTCGKVAKLPKIYDATKHQKKYLGFRFKFRPGIYTVKEDESIQLTLPFISN